MTPHAPASKFPHRGLSGKIDPRFFFTNRNNDRDQKPSQKNHPSFFKTKSILDNSGKNAPRYFRKKRLAIETAARPCRFRRAVVPGTCAQVLNFSQSDRDFSFANAIVIAIENFFRNDRDRFLFGKSRWICSDNWGSRNVFR